MSLLARVREAGRVLSKRNEAKLRMAHGHLGDVLKSCAPAKTQEAASQSATNEIYGGQRLTESFSYSDMMCLLNDAVSEAYPGAHTYVMDLFPETAVYRVVYESNDGRFLFQAPYAVADDGTVTLGDPVEVRSRTVYEPVSSEEAVVTDEVQESAEPGATAPESIEVIGDCIPLREAAIDANGEVLLKLISPGWGSSGYYDPAVLRRDMPKVFPPGTKMFLNHPTALEEAQRPEGEIEKVAAIIKTAPVYMDNGPKGAGSYAKAQVVGSYQPTINQLAPHIGPSIFCKGRAHLGEAAGRKGRIIDELLPSPPRTSIDFVTEPGAGGEVVQLFEAARSAAPLIIPTTFEEVTVTEAQAQELRTENARLKEANDQLNTRVTDLATVVGRLSEATTVGQAERLAAPLIAATRLPMQTQRRLLEAVKVSAPLRDDGTLDVEKFTESVQQVAQAEVTFAREAYGFGSGSVRGMGGAGFAPSLPPGGAGAGANADGSSVTEADLDKRLAESFEARGFSSDNAKLAAGGRVRG